MQFRNLAILALAALTSAAPAASSQTEERAVNNTLPFQLLAPVLGPYFAERLLLDGELLLKKGPADVVEVISGLEPRQEPIAGPVGNGVGCAAGCVPI